MIISESEESDELNIFDADSPTHKKLEYFIWDNTKVEEDTVAQMYFYVISKLYDRNAPLLLNSQDILRIDRSSDNFRAAQEVISGWYIESNIDSNSKFIILKKLLTLFELEEELLIKYAANGERASEPNRFGVRKKYWQQLLPLLNATSLFGNVRPTKDHWLSTGAGIGGVSYTLIVTKSLVRIELGISTSSKELNKSYFQKLLKNRDAIEAAFGSELEWEELPDNKMSRVKYELMGVNLYQEGTWERMNDFFISSLPKFEIAFQRFIKNLR